MRKKQIKVAIIGFAGVGKTLIATILNDALIAHGIKNIAIIDEDFGRNSLVPKLSKKERVKLIKENKDSFEVTIETVQLSRSANSNLAVGYKNGQSWGPSGVSID